MIVYLPTLIGMVQQFHPHTQPAHYGCQGCRKTATHEKNFCECQHTSHCLAKVTLQTELPSSVSFSASEAALTSSHVLDISRCAAPLENTAGPAHRLFADLPFLAATLRIQTATQIGPAGVGALIDNSGALAADSLAAGRFELAHGVCRQVEAPTHSTPLRRDLSLIHI